MIFRFMGQIPKHRFEFTCNCGQWNLVEITVAGPGGKNEFKCEDCGLPVTVWQQNTHWHMSLGGGRKK